MPTECAPGVRDWSTTWHVQDNTVVVTVVWETKEQAVQFADEMARDLRGITYADV